MFDESLRREVVAYTRARAAAGASQAGVAKELGIGGRLIWGWMSEARKVPAIRAVRVAPEVRRPKREKKARASTGALGAAAAARSRATVVLPSGIRIEGLAVEDAVKAARMLA